MTGTLRPGWGLHILASKEPFDTPTADEMIARLPDKAKKDLMEWDKGRNVRDFLNLTLKNENPIDKYMNYRDKSIYISDDRPFNEYFLLRRLRDNNIRITNVMEELFLMGSPGMPMEGDMKADP